MGYWKTAEVQVIPERKAGTSAGLSFAFPVSKDIRACSSCYCFCTGGLAVSLKLVITAEELTT